MADIRESPEMASEGQGMVHGSREESAASTEPGADEDLTKWVSAHAGQARKIICSSADLKDEPFCGEHRRRYGNSFLWRGAAP